MPPPKDLYCSRQTLLQKDLRVGSGSGSGSGDTQELYDLAKINTENN